jgi:hypothetical protein
MIPMFLFCYNLSFERKIKSKFKQYQSIRVLVQPGMLMSAAPVDYIKVTGRFDMTAKNMAVTETR